jgi:7-carboxy-7-deazaguanine synthase
VSGSDTSVEMTTAASSAAERLRITEIFHSIQGEADAIGWRTVFVRLTGCPLRCVWCDTEYSFYGGNWRDIDDILAEVASHGARHVCVTGGGYEVSLETSGALDVSTVDPRVRKVMDLKAPDSGESKRNLWSNLDHLLPHDQVKIVIASRTDYEWAREAVAEHDIDQRCMVLFSPVHGAVEPRALAEWIIEDKLPVRFQLQLHKLLWHDAPGH